MSEQGRPLDLLGISGISDSIKIATGKSLEGAAAFLSRVCLPAAEEFGLALRDRVSAWRAVNATRMLSHANDIHIGATSASRQQINPKLVHVAIEEASWTQDEEIHKLWAGLLASSSTSDGLSDENLIFMNILKQLSSLQVRILKYSVESATKYADSNGLPFADTLRVSTDRLPDLFGSDLNRIDRELDCLVSIGLLGGIDRHGGIHLDGNDANLAPTSLALNLYVRAQGSKDTSVAYWKLKSKWPREPT